VLSSEFNRCRLLAQPMKDAAEVVLTHEFLPTEELREGVRRGWNGCIDMLERSL
jgi:hypothetical protein